MENTSNISVVSKLDFLAFRDFQKLNQSLNKREIRRSIIFIAIFLLSTNIVLNMLFSSNFYGFVQNTFFFLLVMAVTAVIINFTQKPEKKYNKFIKPKKITNTYYFYDTQMQVNSTVAGEDSEITISFEEFSKIYETLNGFYIILKPAEKEKQGSVYLISKTDMEGSTSNDLTEYFTDKFRDKYIYVEV